MEFSKQITVNASAERVWKVIGEDFNDISEWSSFVNTSEAIPNLPEGSGRVCDVKGVGEIVETIVDYDDDGRALAFTVNGGVPFFVNEVVNTWQVEAIDENRSIVTSGVNVDLMPVFKQLLSGRLEKIFQRRLDTILSEMKDFAEKEMVLA